MPRIADTLRKGASGLRARAGFSPRFLRGAKGDSRGTNAVEFALLSAVMLPIFAGVIDFSIYLWNANEVAQAVRAGEQYATANTTDYTGIANVIRASTSLGSSLTVSSDQCQCGVSLQTQMVSIPVTSTAYYGNVTTPLGACSTVAATCTTNGTRAYLRISATYSFSPILGSLSLAPSSTTTTVLLRTQ